MRTSHGDPLLTAMEAGEAKTAGSSSASSSSSSSPIILRMVDAVGAALHCEDCGKRTWKQKLNISVYSVAAAAILFALLSIISFVESSSSGRGAICYIAFCIPAFVTAPYVIHQRRKLNKLPKFRQVINLLRNEANRIVQQNIKFAASNAKLESELTRLKQIEFQLHQKCQASGSSVQEMRALIVENGTYQTEMKVRGG
jgi:hypothetical protein